MADEALIPMENPNSNKRRYLSGGALWSIDFRANFQASSVHSFKIVIGTPGRIRTCDPLLRSNLALSAVLPYLECQPKPVQLSSGEISQFLMDGIIFYPSSWLK